MAVARLVRAGFGTHDEVLDLPYPQFKGYTQALIALEDQSLAKLMSVVAVAQGGNAEAYEQLYNALTGNT